MTADSKTMRVLSLDGGGVRGLSSMIILEQLLYLVNESLSTTLDDHDELLPAEIFDHIVGTSTGGLIGVMLVKLNMSVKECINVYKELCPRIFGKQQFGSCMGGLIIPRYCSENFRKCLQEVFNKYGKLPNGDTVKFMEDTNVNGNKASCTVVCRELGSSGRRLANPAFICSHQSRTHHTHELTSACQATTAAPTFFSRVVIDGRTYVDGAFGHTNNPTRKAHFHFLSKVPDYKDCSVVWINIGTGSPKPYDISTYNSSRRASIVRRTWKDKIIPNAVRQARNLLSDLEAIATDSDRVEEEMEDIINCKSNYQHIVFSRLSANNGVADIQLDDWRNMPKIEVLTRAYLKKPEIVEKLEKIADELATASKQRILQQREQKVLGKREQETMCQPQRKFTEEVEKRASMQECPEGHDLSSEILVVEESPLTTLPQLDELIPGKDFVDPLLPSSPSSSASNSKRCPNGHAASTNSISPSTAPSAEWHPHNHSKPTIEVDCHKQPSPPPPLHPEPHPASVALGDGKVPRTTSLRQSLLKPLLNVLVHLNAKVVLGGKRQ